MTQVFDDLYQKSKNNFSFRNLMDTISSENNIRLAFYKDVHKLIHAIKPETIEKYSNLIEDKKALNKLNKLRTQCNLEPINLVTT